MNAMNDMIVKVVGVTFVDGYPENLYQLNDLISYRVVHGEQDGFPLGEGPAVVLVRNPENPHDGNAIEVHVPSLGQLGHIPKDIASWLAPILDAGQNYIGEAVAVGVHPDHPERPGCYVRLRRVLERV